jgi:hypothetical protein
MDDMLARFASNLIDRLEGPFSFRFLLQPIMAMIYATRDGLADAREHRPPYFWSLFTRPGQRRQLLGEGWTAVTRVIVLGVVMDVLYQLIVFRWIYPGELAVVVLGLAFVPYVLLRGPIERIASWWTTRRIHARPGPLKSGEDRPGRGRHVA